jgi:hypothetical protein
VSSFEQGFEDVERAAQATLLAAKTIERVAKDLIKAASEGDLAKLRKTTERLAQSNELLAQEVANTHDAWPFSAEQEETYLREDYADELSNRAKAESLELHTHDQGLVAFPAFLRIIAAERAVRIDRQRTTALRPTFLVRKLRGLRSKKVKFDASRFVESLYRAYVLLSGRRETSDTVLLERLCSSSE